MVLSLMQENKAEITLSMVCLCNLWNEQSLDECFYNF